MTKEVNEGKNFVQLRQVFYSLILATWYKTKIKDSILNKVYSNRNKITGVNVPTQDKGRIYQEYLNAFKKGVFNYIKEEPDPITNQAIPRKYFSGGVEAYQLSIEYKDPAQVSSNDFTSTGQIVEVTGDMAMTTALVLYPVKKRTYTPNELIRFRHDFLHIVALIKIKSNLLADQWPIPTLRLINRLTVKIEGKNRSFVISKEEEKEGVFSKDRANEFLKNYEEILRRLKIIVQLLESLKQTHPGIFQLELETIILHTNPGLEMLRRFLDPDDRFTPSFVDFREYLLGYPGIFNQIKLSIANHVGHVWLDINKFDRVLHNLVANAREAKGEYPVSITIAAKRVGDRVIMTFSDDGPGLLFDDDHSSKWYFQQGSTTNGDTERPRGIGLAIVKSIIEEHGGTIKVENIEKEDETKGARFTITLPAGRFMHTEQKIIFPNDIRQKTISNDSAMTVENPETWPAIGKLSDLKEGDKIFDLGRDTLAYVEFVHDGHVSIDEKYFSGRLDEGALINFRKAPDDVISLREIFALNDNDLSGMVNVILWSDPNFDFHVLNQDVDETLHITAADIKMLKRFYFYNTPQNRSKLSQAYPRYLEYKRNQRNRDLEEKKRNGEVRAYGKRFVLYSDGFLEGSMYDPEFIAYEKTQKQPTIAVDIDGTILNDKQISRPGFLEELQKLKDMGYRLVICTDRDKEGVKKFLQSHPEFLSLFDSFLNIDNRYMQDGFVYPRVRKDITVLGYALLIDNGYQFPEGEEKPPEGFKHYLITTYRGESEDQEPMEGFAQRVDRVINANTDQRVFSFNNMPKERIYTPNELRGFMHNFSAILQLMTWAYDDLENEEFPISELEKIDNIMRNIDKKIRSFVISEQEKTQEIFSEDRANEFLRKYKAIPGQLEEMLQLLKSLKQNHPETFHPKLDTMIFNANRGLQRLHRFHDPDDRFKPSSVDFKTYLLEYRALSDSINIQTSIADDVGLVRLDIDEFDQVLDNLSLNAMEATKGAPVSITITAKRVDNKVIMTFSDNGPGFSNDHPPNWWFGLGRSTKNNKSEGKRDIGLDSVKSIVEEHDGTITAENIEEGNKTKGARFIITLPADRAMSIEQKIIFPDDIQRAIPENLGEKPEKLIKLRRAGFNVPKFFVVQSNGSGRLDINDALRQAFGGLQKPVIVRSAHPQEGKKHSYSGVFNSYEDISVLAEQGVHLKGAVNSGGVFTGPQSVEAAYEAIVASAETGFRSERYRENLKIDDFDPHAMNVIIMEQVDVDIFGMFVTSDIHDPNKVLVHYQVRGQEEKESGGVIVYDKKAHALEENQLSNHLRGVLIQFAETAAKIEGIFDVQQIELASSKKDGQVYVLQSRTINLGNPDDVPRFAQYKTLSRQDPSFGRAEGRLHAIGYGSYRLPVLVMESVKEATGYEQWAEYLAWQKKWRVALKREDADGEREAKKEMDKIALEAQTTYREEMLAFQEEHTEYILVIKDADSILSYLGFMRGLKRDYDFLNGLIRNAKVVIRGRQQNAIRHEDWDHVDLGGVTIVPSEIDTLTQNFHYRSSGQDSFRRGSDTMIVSGNVSIQWPREIVTGDYLNVLSNIDGAFIWYDDNPASNDSAMTALRNKEGEDYRTVINRLEPDLKGLSVSIYSRTGERKEMNILEYLQGIIDGTVLRVVSDGVAKELQRLESLSNKQLIEDEEIRRLLGSPGFYEMQGEITLEKFLSILSKPGGWILLHHLSDSLAQEMRSGQWLDTEDPPLEERREFERTLKRSQFYIALLFTLLRRWALPGDKAMSVKQVSSHTGGIDLNPAQISTQVRREGNGFKFNFNGTEIDAAQVTGATFTIRTMTPVVNLPLILGLSVVRERSQSIH